jgi:uncharacterized protein with GYD domain
MEKNQDKQQIRRYLNGAYNSHEAKEMAENYGITVDELIKAYGTIDVVKYDMAMHKALEIIKENN